MILNYNHSLKYQHYSQQKSHRHQMSGNSTVHMTLTKAGRYWLITVNGIETNIQFIIHTVCQREIMGFLTEVLGFTVLLILLE